MQVRLDGVREAGIAKEGAGSGQQTGRGIMKETDKIKNTSFALNTLKLFWSFLKDSLFGKKRFSFHFGIPQMSDSKLLFESKWLI